MAENKNMTIWIKYLNHNPVQIDTLYFNNQKRLPPLTNVGHLIAAYFPEMQPNKHANYSLCTVNSDGNTLETLKPGKLLTELSITTDENPLIIKSSNQVTDPFYGNAGEESTRYITANEVLLAEIAMNVDYDWNYLSGFFSGALPIQTSELIIESDRPCKFSSKTLLLYENKEWTLKKGRLPDLRFQNLNLDTKIKTRVSEFMDSNEFLGLLIGPTGCGKTHEMLSRAKTEFTIFIDGQSYPGTNEPFDLSLSSLKQSFESVTNTWKTRNENLPKLRTIGYAFALSRMLFLKFLKELYPTLTPTQFLIHQLFNSKCIDRCFVNLKSFSMDRLKKIRYEYIDFRCLFCVDEAHVLLAHLGDQIITSTEGNHIQQNGDVNENAKRGTLSVLLHGIKDGQFAKKVLFAGTSSKLRHVDNFGAYETKPVAPAVLNQFAAWGSEMAIQYVMSFVDIEQRLLEAILTDNYRPRVLENLVYDLFCIGMNDNESPTTKDERVEKRSELLNIVDVLKESYDAVIHRFTRVSLKPIAQKIKSHAQTEIMLKLLFSSMMTSSGGPINCHLNPNETEFFLETIGSIYLIPGAGGYSFYEGYVIDSFLLLFEDELRRFQLSSSLNLLKNIIGLEGKKTTAKGTPFEAVILADIINLNSPYLSQVLAGFGIVAKDGDGLRLPTKEEKLDDEIIISERPLNVFLRPSNQFRPDIVAFLSKQVCLSFGIKLYTSRISLAMHTDNFESTSPDLFFSKAGRPTNLEKYSHWQRSLKDSPLKLTVRFLIELPEPVNTAPIEITRICNNANDNVVIVITKSNMRKLLSEDISLLVDFITSL